MYLSVKTHLASEIGPGLDLNNNTISFNNRDVFFMQGSLQKNTQAPGFINQEPKS
jgi:hypothetical protein